MSTSTYVAIGPASMKAASRRDAQQPARAPSLLIVDDVTDTREMKGLYFRLRGFTVFTALDGRSGIDAAIVRQSGAVEGNDP